MSITAIEDNISYIEASSDPLSADVGIITEKSGIFLYDVGNGDVPLKDLSGRYSAVLSHFHPDHMGNVSRLALDDIYLSSETMRHLRNGIDERTRIHIVTERIDMGDMRIIPIPSSHAKGSLALEVGGRYAFVGDALYAAVGKNGLCYNAQILKEEISVIEKMDASFLLVSHFKGLKRRKEDVLKELEEIYSMREKGNPFILLPR